MCRQYGVSLIPYSPLAGGHLTHKEWLSDSKRSATDRTLRAKYDHAQVNDMQIIARVAELAEKHDVPMAVIALAWHFAKGVASPIVGAGKVKYLEDAAKAVDFVLSEEEVKYLEELYEPHRIVGAL